MLDSVTNNWVLLNEGGGIAVAFTSFINMDLKTENKIIQAPTEEGGFVAYNKVRTPLDIGLQVAISGSVSDLESAVSDLLALSSSTQLLSLITPEREYQSLNLTKLAWRRVSEEGTNVIYVDCGLAEVRQVTSEYTNTKVAKRRSRGRQQAKETSVLAGGRDWIKRMI